MRKSALAVAGSCLALVACGGKQRAVQPLTRQAFLAAANSICKQATTRGGRLARLRALQPPSADRDVYRRWLRAEEDALAISEALAHPTEAKQPEGDPLVPLVIAEGKAAGYARRLGATACVTMPG